MKYLVLASLAAFAAGCGAADPFTPYLPAGTTLSNPATLDLKEPAKPAGDKLAELGAHVGEDGHLYDRGGREIYFWYDGPGSGIPVPPQEADRKAEERERRRADVRKRYTVVIILYRGEPVP